MQKLKIKDVLLKLQETSLKELAEEYKVPMVRLRMFLKAYGYGRTGRRIKIRQPYYLQNLAEILKEIATENLQLHLEISAVMANKLQTGTKKLTLDEFASIINKLSLTSRTKEIFTKK